jgi:cyclopropane fatty-acyl-phospholipid synthase-like methyltransferase
VRRLVVRQFQNPSGMLGRMAGWIMAHRESNLRRNEWTVSLLEIEPEHQVLELGCGPGVGLRHAAQRATEGHVVGVDHSELMVKAARRHNAEAVRKGQIEVIHGSAQAAADWGRRFDRVFAVNVVQFWDAPQRNLRALREIMAPGGTMAIAFQPRNQGATDADALRGAERNRELLAGAGFRDLRTETLDLEPLVTCVLGRA